MQKEDSRGKANVRVEDNDKNQGHVERRTGVAVTGVAAHRRSGAHCTNVNVVTQMFRQYSSMKYQNSRSKTLALGANVAGGDELHVSEGQNVENGDQQHANEEHRARGVSEESWAGEACKPRQQVTEEGQRRKSERKRKRKMMRTPLQARGES